ncbi:MAG: hypothetical protein HQM16_01400 [Deltaproteobacteria bacterium]|nr:hypothetical protein [Deltaproteobacteria bacterium]
MSFDQQVTDFVNPSNVKIKMLNANVANCRPRVADSESRGRVFDLLVKTYLKKAKEGTITSGLKNASATDAANTPQRETMMNILMGFKKILKK